MTPDKTKYKTGIRRKVILIICLSTFIVMMMSVSLGYFFGLSVLRDMVGDVHRKLSQLLSSQVTRIFDEEMARIKSYSDAALWKDAVIKSNLKYQAMEKAAAKASFTEMIEQWKRTDKDGFLSREGLDNDVSAGLKTLMTSDAAIAEMAVFDRFGALVGASGEKTSRFYPGDKWHKEFLASKDKVFIGDIEFDEGPKAWVIPVAMLIRGPDGDVIGIFRAELSTDKFFSFLGQFRMDNTGHAVLIDGKGNIIYHPGVTQINIKLCGAEDYRRLLTSKGKYATIYEPNIHKRKVFVAFSEVTPPILLDSGKVWRVMIDEDAQEVFAPLYRIVAWMAVAVLFLLIVMVVIGYFFSGVLVKPILELNVAAVQIMKGNWDYKINIRTGDEIEQFADAFKEMISNIQGKQEQLKKTKDELEVLSTDLEKRVRERTIDLTTARDRLDKYAKELKSALMVKSDFISMASHELRTPLTAIKEGISIVLGGRTGAVSGQQKEFLDMAKRNLDRLGRVIDEILDFQKLEYGKAALKMEEHDINEIIREACNTMISLAVKKKLELSMNLGSGLPLIRFDRDRITQVMTNLVDNALKFTEKGSVTITTSQDNNVVKVAIRDTGSGIKEEDMPLLFQKFSQLERGLERKPGGSGLGLTISKEIIELHRGKIWAESKFGEGMTFFFVLPIKERRI